MNKLFVILLCGAALAQQTKPPEQPKPAGQAPAAGEAKAAAEPQPEPAAAEAPITPVAEKDVAVTIDTGYRFLSGVGGSFPTYRSVVNLGEGPKLFGFDFTLNDPKKRLFDRLAASAQSWGGEPYNTLRLSAEKAGWYRLNADYRNIAYYNFLPTFATVDFQLNQRSYDMLRRSSSFELEFRPGALVSPYAGFARDAGSGSGITPYVANGNDYPVATALRDETNLYRGGVRVNGRQYHVTLELGGATLKDDQRVFTGERNPGNRTTPIFNNTLVLESLEQAYGIRGRNFYQKAVLTAAPADWAHLYAQFIHSQPRTDVRYSDGGRGVFFLGGTRFFNGFGTLTSGEARLPRNSASAGADLRWGQRVRLVESWMTDRFHNAASLLIAEQFLFASTAAELQSALANERLVLNFSRQQTDLFLDVTSRVTLRGGQRYTWGDAVTPGATIAVRAIPGRGLLRQHAALAGFTVRLPGNGSVNLDYEGSPGDRSYFRTSLHEYHQVRARARAEIHPSLHVSANFLFLDNRNPAARAEQGFDYEFRSRAFTAGFEWTPQAGKHITLLGDYTRSTLRSRISFIVPQDFFRDISFYRDNAHTASALLDIRLPGKQARTPSFALGGSFFKSNGSRPTDYYQPLVRFKIPLAPSVEAYAEWRWFGLAQAFFPVEGFRSHLSVVGLRLSR